jgi:ABC-2 type transport system permease protein
LLYLIVFAYVFVTVCFMMYNISEALCAPLTAVGMDWLFFAIIGFFAIGMSVVFGLFTSQPMLYDAKDNDLLLALPIPASKILLSRMLLLYVQNLLCSVLILAPALVVYTQTVGADAVALALQVMILLIMPLLCLVIECVVGWIIALISSKMRNKNIVTVVLSLALLAAYFYFVGKMPDYMNYIIANSQQVGSSLVNAFYPFYKMGLGASGDVESFLIFAGISLAVFALVYLLLSVSFIRIIAFIL